MHTANPVGRKEQTSGEKRTTLKCVTRNNMFVSIAFARLYRPAQLFVAAYLDHKCVKYKFCTQKFCICLRMRYLENKIVQIPPPRIPLQADCNVIRLRIT
jgi:hypothetical protein